MHNRKIYTIIAGILVIIAALILLSGQFKKEHKTNELEDPAKLAQKLTSYYTETRPLKFGPEGDEFGILSNLYAGYSGKSQEMCPKNAECLKVAVVCGEDAKVGYSHCVVIRDQILWLDMLRLVPAEAADVVITNNGDPGNYSSTLVKFTKEGILEEFSFPPSLLSPYKDRIGANRQILTRTILEPIRKVVQRASR